MVIANSFPSWPMSVFLWKSYLNKVRSSSSPGWVFVLVDIVYHDFCAGTSSHNFQRVIRRATADVYTCRHVRRGNQSSVACIFYNRQQILLPLHQRERQFLSSKTVHTQTLEKIVQVKGEWMSQVCESPWSIGFQYYLMEKMSKYSADF